MMDARFTVGGLESMVASAGANWVSVREAEDVAALVFVFFTLPTGPFVEQDWVPSGQIEAAISAAIEHNRAAAVIMVPVRLPERALPSTWLWETTRGPKGLWERWLCLWDHIWRRLPRRWPTVVEVKLQ